MTYLSRDITPNVSGDEQDFAVSKPYLDRSHVHVYTRDPATSVLTEISTSGFSWSSDSLIHITTAPAAGLTVERWRITPNRTLSPRLSSGSVVVADTVNAMVTQVLYIEQELDDVKSDVEVRAVRAPQGETLTVLPAAASRKGKVAGFDAGTGDVALFDKTDFYGPPGPSSLITGLNVYTPEQFGAVGDGSTLDDAAFAALRAAIPSGGTIFLSFHNYRLSAGQVFTSKSNISIYSAGATITFQGAITGFTFTNCSSIRTSGPLNIVVEHASGVGLSISGQTNCAFADWAFTGAGGAGNLGAPATKTYGGIPVPDVTPIKSFRAIGMARGFNAIGEYYDFQDCIVIGCAGYGYLFQGGNPAIDGGMVLGNRIGIEVDGGVIANSDHGRISNCTINHNLAAGIYLRNLTYGFQITGCIIGGSIGDGTSNGQLSEEGRTTSFGLYVKNAKCVLAETNTYIRNRVNIGLDGVVNSRFGNCLVLSDDTRTTDHLKEYGANNTTYGRNANNHYGNNTYDSTLFGGSTKRINLLTTTSSIAHNTKGSQGNTGNQVLLLDNTVSAATAIDGNYDHIILISDCTAVITASPCFTYGQQFAITYVQASVGASKNVTVTSVTTLTILCSGLTAAGDVLTFSEAGEYTFTPADLFGKWVVTKARGGADAVTALTLSNSWTNFGAGTAALGYFKGGDGLVYMRGTLAPTGGSGTVVSTLPAGYRPASVRNIRLASDKNAFYQVATSGTVTIFYDAGATFVSFDSSYFNLAA